MANQQSRWVGGVILIVIGSIFLLANLDLIDRDTLHQLWKFWPLILILLGVRMLVRNEHCRRPPDA
ncbi:MAG: DUF5668 domain-containing protein [Proteobacteria bacterium]|nr:DUF5668 domain-containing protein [Pseudomonadota bacterium]